MIDLIDKISVIDVQWPSRNQEVELEAPIALPLLSSLKYTLRQKFSIIICVKGGKNIWLELIAVNKCFDTIVLIRCHGYGGNNQDFNGFKIGS